MSIFSRLVQRTLGRFLSGLRFPQLFGVTAVIFVVDLLLPDAVPFVDEVLLGMLSLLLGSLRKRKADTDRIEGSDRIEGGDQPDASSSETPGPDDS